MKRIDRFESHPFFVEYLLVCLSYVKTLLVTFDLGIAFFQLYIPQLIQMTAAKHPVNWGMRGKASGIDYQHVQFVELLRTS